jgi:putative membrane protein
MAERGLAGESLQDSTEKAVGLTRFLSGSLPSSFRIFISIVLLSFFVGVIASLLSGNSLTASVAHGGGEGLFIIGVPAVLSSAICFLMRRKIRFKKILFVSFVAAMVYSLFYIAARLIETNKFSMVGSFNVMLVGNALVFALWFSVTYILFNIRKSSLFFGIVQPTLNMVFFLAYGPIATPQTAPELVLLKLYLASSIFLVAVYAMFWLVNAPMKRTFGVSGIEAGSLFLAQWFERSKKLEDIFDEVGVEIDTLLGVMAFKAKNKLKCVFLIPYVHFGPFGNLGGSEFPYLLSNAVNEATDAEVMVFHGTATHDFNPVSTEEVVKFIKKTQDALKGMRFKKASGSISLGKHETCRAYGLVINNKGFLALTRAPRTTEDIDFSLGLAFRNRAIASGLEEAMVADAHNAETGEITRVEAGDPLIFEYMDAIREAVEKRKKDRPIKLGVAADSLIDLGKEACVGKDGMKVALFEFDREKFAFILFDGNSILPSIRKEIINAVKEMGIRCEVMTTDSHSANVVSGVINPIGRVKSDEIIIRACQCVSKAAKNLESVEADMRVEKVEGVRVFGVSQSQQLIGTVNSIVAVMRVVAPLLFLGAALFALWVITKI